MNPHTQTPHKPATGFRPLTLAVILIGTALFFLITFFATRAVPPDPGWDARRGAERLQKRLAIDEDASLKLSTVGWVDRQEGTVHIPIEKAMELVVKELKNKPLRPHSPVDGGLGPVSPPPAVADQAGDAPTDPANGSQKAEASP